jgi:hypothetical protein
VRQMRPLARQPRMIGNLLAVRKFQKNAQQIRVRATPRVASVVLRCLVYERPFAALTMVT